MQKRVEFSSPIDRVPLTAGDVSLPGSYLLEPIVTGLSYPTSVTFDDDGNVYIGEAGYSYGPAKADGMGRILKVNRDGSMLEIARGFKGPMTGLTWHKGYFYVAEGSFPGSIIRVSKDGKRQVLIQGLRSGGDHYTSEIAFAPDDTMFFGVGTFTNSAVVGLDNLLFGWLPDYPFQHDVPARDVVLKGVNYPGVDPLTLAAKGSVKMIQTGAYKPVGVPTFPNELIPGQLFANGVLYRCRTDGSGLHVYADGLRNVFGLRFSSNGRLYAIDQGYDDRGSRSVANAPDPMWEIIPGGWYGFPDFVAGEPITNPEFRPEGKPQPQFVLAAHPALAGKPITKFVPHSATMKFDFCKNPLFGFVNEAFVAQFGTGAPVTGRSPGMPGFKVMRVNINTGQTNDFLVINRPGPGGTGPSRPVDVKFDPTGLNLYLVDFGVLEANLGGVIPWARSGSLWRIRKKT